MQKGVYPPIDYVYSRMKKLGMRLFYGIIYFWASTLTLALYALWIMNTSTNYLLPFFVYPILVLVMCLLSIYTINEIDILQLFYNRGYLTKSKGIFILSQYIIAIASISMIAGTILYFGMPYFAPIFFYTWIALMFIGGILSTVGIIGISIYLFNFGVNNKMLFLILGSVFLVVLPGIGSVIVGAAIYEAAEELSLALNHPQIIEKIENYVKKKIEEEKRPVNPEHASAELGAPPILITYIVNKLIGEDKIKAYKYKGGTYPL
ncbi:MAG: hypothetical protein ACP6IP_07030 [Candidatus Njordarchaeia archaeon]